MPGSSFYLFANQADFRSLLGEITADSDLNFWPELGLLNQESNPMSVEQILSDFCRLNGVTRSRILVGRNGLLPRESKVVMSDGSGWKTARDPLMNPEFILVLPGKDAEPQVLVSTMVSSQNETRLAKELFGHWKKVVKKRTTFMGGFYVSSGAMARASAGTELRSHAGERVLALR